MSRWVLYFWYSHPFTIYFRVVNICIFLWLIWSFVIWSFQVCYYERNNEVDHQRYLVPAVNLLLRWVFYFDDLRLKLVFFRTFIWRLIYFQFAGWSGLLLIDLSVTMKEVIKLTIKEKSLFYIYFNLNYPPSHVG